MCEEDLEEVGALMVMRLRGKVDIRILVIKHGPKTVERLDHLIRLPIYP